MTSQTNAALERWKRADQEFRAATADLHAAVETDVMAARNLTATATAPRSLLLNVHVIKSVVAKHFNLTIAELDGSRGAAHVSDARQDAMVACRVILHAPLVTIGKLFGNRDHGTVVHAEVAVKARSLTNPSYKRRHELVLALCADAIERGVAAA